MPEKPPAETTPKDAIYREGWQDANHAWQKWLDANIPDWDAMAGIDLTTLPRGTRMSDEHTTIRGSLCGPKYLRGIVVSCDGSCCGMKNGKVDHALTDRLNRRAEAWRRITSGEVQL